MAHHGPPAREHDPAVGGVGAHAPARAGERGACAGGLSPAQQVHCARRAAGHSVRRECGGHAAREQAHHGDAGRDRGGRGEYD